jgi:phosphoribosylcarboxyaminoimidazole (NCAIR) mutase
MMKNVLVLVGSNNDINEKVDGEDKPKQIVKDLEATVKRINKENKNQTIRYHLDSVSADRTPQCLAPVINEDRYDGIIYHGGYSLVLGAAIQEALTDLRSHMGVTDPREEIREALIHNPDKMYIMGGYDKSLVKEVGSKYFRDGSFIPTIGVPGKDSISTGVTALTSIVENPSGCEPRPVVGLNRLANAMECMQKILYGIGSHEDVAILYETSEQKEPAQKILKRLDNFGLKECSIMSWDAAHQKEQNLDSTLYIYVGEDYQASKKGDKVIGPVVQSADGLVNFMINCPVKRDMSKEMPEYLDALTSLDRTVSVGAGNYDNAAILAAEIWNDPNVLAGMWEYRNNKTIKGVIEKPSWLIGGK